MKKVLKNSKKTKKYLDSLPKIYLIGYWASAGIQEYYFSNHNTQNGVPLVWYFNDHNGEYERWYLKPIDCITTGHTFAWTTSKAIAQEIADVYNKFHMQLINKGL